MKHKDTNHTNQARATHNLKPGHYLYWRRQIYRIVEREIETTLQVLAETVPEAARVPLSLLDLFTESKEEHDPILVAPSLEVLTSQIEEHYSRVSEPGMVLSHDLPDTLLIKARLIISIVEMIQKLVCEEEQRALTRRQPFSRTQALRRALATCNGSRVQIQIHDQEVEHILHVGLTSYYKYERLYTLYQGDEAHIAASFRRSTFRSAHLSRAQLHFIDTCLLQNSWQWTPNKNMCLSPGTRHPRHTDPRLVG